MRWACGRDASCGCGCRGEDFGLPFAHEDEYHESPRRHRCISPLKTAYTYTVLRYIHDTTTGEFVNVGVALSAPKSLYLGALCRTTYGRLTKVFPGVDGEAFKSLMRYIQSSFAAHGERLSKELPLNGKAPTVMEIARAVLPRDDSALQWSEMGSGLADDPSFTLEKLYRRMVEAYEQTTRQGGRTDDDVWKKYRKEMEQRHVLARLAPKTISSAAKDDEVEFEHAWKNEQWHCVEALSFDLLEADSIQDRAHRWLGQMASVKDSPEPFQTPPPARRAATRTSQTGIRQGSKHSEQNRGAQRIRARARVR